MFSVLETDIRSIIDLELIVTLFGSWMSCIKPSRVNKSSHLLVSEFAIKRSILKFPIMTRFCDSGSCAHLNR